MEEVEEVKKREKGNQYGKRYGFEIKLRLIRGSGYFQTTQIAFDDWAITREIALYRLKSRGRPRVPNVNAG